MFCGNPLSAVHKSTATRAEAGSVRQKSRTQAWKSCGKAKRAVALSSSCTRGVRSILDYRIWGIYFTQVGPIYCGWRRQPWRSTHHRLLRRRSHRYGLLGEAQEDLSSATRVPSIETKRELVHVVIQVLLLTAPWCVPS